MYIQLFNGHMCIYKYVMNFFFSHIYVIRDINTCTWPFPLKYSLLANNCKTQKRDLMWAKKPTGKVIKIKWHNISWSFNFHSHGCRYIMQQAISDVAWSNASSWNRDLTDLTETRLCKSFQSHHTEHTITYP